MHEFAYKYVQVCPRNPVVTAPTSQAVAQAAAAGLSVPATLVPSVVLAAFTADSSSLITVDVRPSTLAGGWVFVGWCISSRVFMGV